MRLYWYNKIRVNVTVVSECSLKMDLCKEGKKIRVINTGEVWHIN